jgi:hypothetical protein
MSTETMPADCDTVPGSDNRRCQRRVNTDLVATVREFGRSGSQCRVRDFSPEGCRLHDCDFAPNAEVWIKFSGISPVRARVVWAHSGLAGCHFYEPLSPRMISLARLAPSDES